MAEEAEQVVHMVTNIFTGLLPQAMYSSLQQTVPLTIGSVNLEGSNIELTIQDKPLVSDTGTKEDTELDRAEAYASTRPTTVRAYNKRTKEGTTRVDSHKRASSKPALEKQIQNAEMGEVPPMQSITFDVDDVVGNAVDASIEQVVAYLKSEMA